MILPLSTNHHDKTCPLFPVKLLVDGEAVTPEIRFTEALLTLSCDAGFVEICFENTETVRMRGEGVHLLLGERELLYACGENLFAINKPFTRR